MMVAAFALGSRRCVSSVLACPQTLRRNNAFELLEQEVSEGTEAHNEAILFGHGLCLMRFIDGKDASGEHVAEFLAKTKSLPSRCSRQTVGPNTSPR